jgi:surface antigen
MPNLTIQQAAQYAKNAGFTGNDLVTILAIAMAESNLNTDVVNGIGATGILQIYLKAHPDVTSAQAKDPQFSFNYGYKLFKARGNFCDWQSYDCKICGNCNPTTGWDNRYKQFIPQVQAALGQSVSSSASTKSYKQGGGNPFDPTFRGQCTWWTQERYHQLTGLWTPMTGNAYQWLAQAQANGWESGDKPPNGIPSIICLQGNAGQGILSSLGHVAVVEKVNSDGSVLTSDMNWSVGSPFNTDINTYGYPVRQVQFKPGTGVSFIWTGQPSTSTPDSGGSASGDYGSYLTLLDQVHETLINVPGFYGMALAIDEAEQFPGWIDLTDKSKTWDITGWLRSIGASITDNFVPFVIRGSLVSLGIIIIILLIARTLSDISMPILSIAKEVV